MGSGNYNQAGGKDRSLCFPKGWFAMFSLLRRKRFAFLRKVLESCKMTKQAS
ncbi:hypothetical protein KNP414_02282 [Paenibacillus mucilaginosus KNP414]|uniref:Uncharacterized protein n=1 Tax=Paenibacillus mucilaginosus (strain KNP414) TaxID=1036673 RepID=F8F7T9_PAEMK|nr:hypothetical protein KNP414_02282 [Paenibacillus mucilaginosus KNP414]